MKRERERGSEQEGGRERQTNQTIHKGRLRGSISLAQDIGQASCTGDNGKIELKTAVTRHTGYKPKSKEFHGNSME